MLYMFWLAIGSGWKKRHSFVDTIGEGAEKRTTIIRSVAIIRSRSYISSVGFNGISADALSLGLGLFYSIPRMVLA